MEELKQLLNTKTALDKTDLAKYVKECNSINKKMKEIILQDRPLKKVDIDILDCHPHKTLLYITKLDPEVLNEIANNYPLYMHDIGYPTYLSRLKERLIAQKIYIPALLNIMARTNYEFIDGRIYDCKDLRLIFKYSNNSMKIYSNRTPLTCSWFYTQPHMISHANEHGPCKNHLCRYITARMSYKYSGIDEIIYKNANGTIKVDNFDKIQYLD